MAARSLRRVNLRSCTDRDEPLLGTGIIKMSTRCSTDSDSPNHFSTDFDGQPPAQYQNIAVHVPKGLQRGNFRDEIS